jgi:hypothetical protein
VTTVLVTGDQTILLKHALSVTLNSLVILSALRFRGNSGAAPETNGHSKTLENGNSKEENGSKSKNNNNKKNKKKNKNKSD